MATTVISLFKVTIVIMIFYSVAITLFTYSLGGQAATFQQMGVFSSGTVDINEINQKVTGSLTKQLGIPLIAQFGALILYSGNMLVDLLLNFYFALPQMFMILINGLMLLFNVDAYISATVQILINVGFGAMYLIAVIQMLVNLRSRGTIIG